MVSPSLLAIYLASVARLVSAVPSSLRHHNLHAARHTILSAQQSDDASSISQGWSLQSTRTIEGANSCGGGAYCPKSLHCDAGIGGLACCSSGTG